MFGYAINETPSYMPLSIDLSHTILEELAHIRHNERDLMPYLRPDAKSQVTVIYNEEHQPVGIDTIVLSTQHDEFIKPIDDSPEAIARAEEQMIERIREDVLQILIPRVRQRYDTQIADLITNDIKLFINPTGKFVIGGPHGDTGLTGRKIIVDTYGGRASHGGGAFSGKDPSKVDRSAAYAARHIAKNMVAAGVCDEILVQMSYAIGVAEPINIYVNTKGTSTIAMSDAEIAVAIGKLFDLRPYAIEQRLKLRNPIYEETAAYGHFGRTPKTCVKTFPRIGGGVESKEVELFTWEKLDYIDRIREHFQIR